MTNEETMTGAELLKVINIILAREWNYEFHYFANPLHTEEYLRKMTGDCSILVKTLSYIVPNEHQLWRIEEINFFIGIAQELHRMRGEILHRMRGEINSVQNLNKA